MSKIILDYSSYYEDKFEYKRNGSGGNIKLEEYNKPNNINKFFKKREDIAHFVKRKFLSCLLIQEKT